MAEVIKMPRLSDTMEEGTVATWLKKVGDAVSEGDILAEIETDKATMEFESFYEGTLLHIGIAEGETASVDSLLAIIGEKDEDISDLLDGKSSNDKSDSDSDEDEDSTSTDKDEKSSDTEKSEDKDSEEDDSDDASYEDGSNEESELPEGVEIITMPRLSDTMEEGTVSTWLKKEGDKVEEGDILAEIETDKATMEFESFYSGTLLKIGIPEGESAPVDQLLAIIGPEGTDVSGILEGAKKGGKSLDKKEEKSFKEDKSEKKSSDKDSKKEEKTVSTENKKESGSEISSPSNVLNEGRIIASPLAKRLAEEKGINLRQVQGSGENGRIVKADIENYQPASGQAYIPVGTESFEEVKNSQMRKTIAKRLSE